MINKLQKKEIDILLKIGTQCGDRENKIIEHMILSQNPMKIFLNEIQFYKPSEIFIGSVLLMIGKKLNNFIDYKPTK